MKHRILGVCILTMALFCGAGGTARAQDDIALHRSCARCGMDRKAYGYSRMLVRYADSSQVGVCSLHCAVNELEKGRGRKVASLLVADRDTRVLVDAETASWVIGGSRRGVMTQRPKWAFATKDASRAFVAANGGRTASWDEALAAVREDAASNSR